MSHLIFLPKTTKKSLILSTCKGPRVSVFGMGSIEQGARNAVITCMGVNSGEHVLIVSDHDTHRIGKALAKEAELKSGPSNVRLLYLEDLASRPLEKLPPQIKQLLEGWADVTFWAAKSLQGELVQGRSSSRLSGRAKLGMAICRTSQSS